MKQVYTLMIALVMVSAASFAQTRPVNRINTWYGDWSNNSSWTLGRVPEDGDSIVVYGGRGILVDRNVNLKNVYIKVIDNNSYIHLKGKLILDENSYVELGLGARIMGFGANRNTETITIGGVRKFDQNSNINTFGFGIASRFTGTAPAGFSTNVAMALPVKFTGFIAKRQGENVLLSWSTAEEQDNGRFEIEKSTDSRNWKSIAVVFGNGTTSATSNYSYTDKNENAVVVYYRIRQVDLNGVAAYSAVKTVKTAGAVNDATIYASSNNTVTVQLDNGTKSNMQVVIVNTNGQVVAKQVFSNASYRVNVSLNNVQSGLYVVQVSDNNGWNETKKLVF